MTTHHHYARAIVCVSSIFKAHDSANLRQLIKDAWLPPSTFTFAEGARLSQLPAIFYGVIVRPLQLWQRDFLIIDAVLGGDAGCTFVRGVALYLQSTE